MSSNRLSVLVVGSGGREHAIVRTLSNSKSVNELYAYPGSSGILKEAKSFSLDPKASNSEIVARVKDLKIDMVVIGPEKPLVDGLSDSLRKEGVLVVGPSSEGAKLEGDKVYAKEFMNEFNIPTGGYIALKTQVDLDRALEDDRFINPYVFKYRYLAGGKGVLVSKDKDEVKSFSKKYLNDQSVQAYLEEPLHGWELSCICLVNESGYEICPILQDHKRLKDGDEGPNTGGMGVAGPLKVDAQLMSQIEEDIVKPSVEGIKRRDILFRGVLYIGVMVTDEGPRVLEYNVRFGDPEAQLIFPLVKSDWGESLYKLAQGESFKLTHSNQYACAVVLAAKGYPEAPKKGAFIKGLDKVDAKDFYHAGTRLGEDSVFKVNGGRVLNVLGFGDSLKEAIEKAYENVVRIQFDGMQKRTDIGLKLFGLTSSIK